MAWQTKKKLIEQQPADNPPTDNLPRANNFILNIFMFVNVHPWPNNTRNQLPSLYQLFDFNYPMIDFGYVCLVLGLIRFFIYEYDQAFAQSNFFGLLIQSKSNTKIWLKIQIQIHFLKWIDNPIQIQSQSSYLIKTKRHKH